jgi:hypothetical protein
MGFYFIFKKEVGVSKSETPPAEGVSFSELPHPLQRTDST